MLYIRKFKSFVNPSVTELTEATNELINDDKVQPLTTAEVEALKQSGIHSSVRTVRLCQIVAHRPVAGNHSETDRTTRKLCTQDRVQQRKIQEAERSQVPVVSPPKSCERLTRNDII
jgi:hypothetical protein